ncbi:MAG: exosome complex exonuclease Rrp41 [Candidatus Marsarchaeota archaeon]|nr:exosome complex exonuclease Rrp41 [Candidatus Marsarchaeota archaeon]MCL5094496.1 exosome complex exonuclease Rrp41 [Candidatus Marsarchaeota archaeon]
MASSLNKPELLRQDGKRLDGRDFDELRPLKITANVIKNANGSAYTEWGNNKVLAAVYGPKEVVPKHLSDPSKAVIKCRYAMAPFSSLSDHGRSGPNRRATEISKVTREVFENVVLTKEFPDTAIEISIEILQSDGGTRAAGITTAAVALANAGIPMKDLVYAVSAGKIKDNIVLDLNMIEDNYSDADMPVAIAPRNNNILLLQMDGGLTKAQINSSLDKVINAGKIISKIQRQALLDVYKID